jgi:DNA-binding transcriptional LysR family regulator
MMTENMHQGKLVRVLEDFCRDEISVHAVFQQSRYLTPKLRSFIDFLYQRFQDERYWT